MPHGANCKGVHQRVPLVDLVKDCFATNVWKSQAVAIERNAIDNTVNNACGVGVRRCSESQLVHHCNWSCTHSQDVPHDATNTGCCSLEGLDVAGVVVAFNLESNCHSLADIDNASVLSHADHEIFFHLRGYLLTKLAQVNLGGLVAAVL